MRRTVAPPNPEVPVDYLAMSREIYDLVEERKCAVGVHVSQLVCFHPVSRSFLQNHRDDTVLVHSTFEMEPMSSSWVNLPGRGPGGWPSDAYIDWELLSDSGGFNSVDTSLFRRIPLPPDLPCATEFGWVDPSKEEPF